MKHVPIRLGPLALLLAVISICLTVLSILSFTTGQADMRLAERYDATVREHYILEADGMKAVQVTCESMNSDMAPDGSFWLVKDSGPQLSIVMKPRNGRWTIEKWVYEAPWEENTQMDGIWMGE